MEWVTGYNLRTLEGSDPDYFGLYYRGKDSLKDLNNQRDKQTKNYLINS